MRPQAGVNAALGQQLGVGAFFHDVAAVHDDEAVHRGDGGEAVGNGDHGLALHEAVQALLDGGFHLGVQRAGGFVQQQDGRVFEHDAGNGHALALAARELHAALAHMGFIAAAALRVGQGVDEGGGLGALGGGVQFFLAGIGAAVEDVVAHRTVQQRGVLRDHANGVAQAVLRHF